MSEKHHQQAVIQVIRMYRWGNLLFAIPNGGKRDKGTAINLKREGVLPGIPDLFLACAANDFHGLFIEMKFGKNKPTQLQIECMERLTKNGYLCVVCYTAEEAINIITDYMKDF